MARTKRFFFYVSVLLIAPLFAAELGLRVLESRFGVSRGTVASGTPVSRALVSKVFLRFERMWFTPPERKPYPFRPPYDVFVNRGADDPGRMALIAQHAVEPKDGKWTAENFLLPPDLQANASYEVSINQWGYRDPAREAEKAAGVFRIATYGAYTAFGFGVNDENSYVRVLERTLNRDSKHRIEVWNGGRPGATAIMGLARLEAEFETVKPDLLLWDFGLVDLALRSDVHELGTGQLRTTRAPLIYGLLKAICPRSENYPIEICIRSIEWLSRVDVRDAIENWREISKRMIAFASEHHIPVLILRHSNIGIPKEDFEKLADPARRIYLVDTAEEMRKPPAPELVDEFWRRPNWTIESGMSRDEIMKDYSWTIYLKDAIQYNERGHEVIARVVADKLRAENLLPQPGKQ